ncbi:MAG TPA: glycosyltransferase family 2 protein [Desulfomonilaceae bacterium]|nr:glycosyltransferase family 2 protein [Desulfomonilaceae bacterium]
MTEHLPKSLSVIIVNRNTADLLVRCIGHVYGSDLPETPEVCVVDNGSSDDSVKRVREVYPEAIVIEAGRNLGFAAANNLAFAETAGRFVLLVNTDAMLDEACAGKLLSLMTTDVRIGMAGPQLLNEDGTPQTSYEAVPTLATETLNRSLLKRLFPGKYPGKTRLFAGPQPVEALIGAVMMIRRDALDELHGFDEDYFFFLEETDLAVRMRKGGWKVVHEPGAKAFHLQGATAKTYQAGARIEFYRSRYLFFQKHYGVATAGVLRGVMTANLALNVLGLGIATACTLGRANRLTGRLKVRSQLWKWHLNGCPEGWGLPRT